jgi:hypothetical protein
MALLAGYDLAARVLEGAGGYRAQRPRLALDRNVRSFGALLPPRASKLDPARLWPMRSASLGTFTAASGRSLADGAMTKRFHPGKTAENRLRGAARAGRHDGSAQVLEAKWGGFFSTYSPRIATPEATLDGLGKEFRIDRSGMKPYACCRGLHACLDALFPDHAGDGRRRQRHPPHDCAR